MDKLSQLIEDRVEEGRWLPLRIKNQGPAISHLLFADDLLIFVEATVDQIENVMVTMEEFCNISGLKISPTKTTIVFSNNVKQNIKNQIKMYAIIKKSHVWGERVQSKLKGWKAQCLSLARRITLAKSVLGPIANFEMQHDRVPKGIYLEIKKAQRRFIWGRLRTREECIMMVKDFVNEEGEWNTLLRRKFLPETTIQNIRAMPTPKDDLREDSIGWRHTSNGVNATGEAKRKKIWSWKGPERIRIFIWRVAHGRILTTKKKAKILGTNPNCINSSNSEESIIHALRDCLRAEAIWIQLLSSSTINVFFNLQLQQWTEFNLQNNIGKSSDFDWIDIFFLLHGIIKPTLRRTSRRTTWEAPPQEWVKLHIDGSVQEMESNAGYGGLIRTNTGEWVGGFWANVGSCGVFQEELWGVIHGIRTVWELGMRRMIIEMDSLEVF
ncbi:hypothetical protein AHAS_Ahas20G0036600 [Arachis hypogaea]